MLAALRVRMEPHVERWLLRRNPPAETVRLDHRLIFIFPTRAGLVYLALVLLLLVTAINYQNNAIYLLAFLLVGQLVVAMFLTYANLAGLRLRRGSCVPAFAGDRVAFRLHLQREAGRRHYAIAAGWPGQGVARSSLDGQSEAVVELYHDAPRRGLLRPGRVRVETVYPLGLFRAWSWQDLQLACWVYPRPRMVRPLPVAARALGAGRCSDQQRDEFSNIRPWRPSDPPRQVLWKAFAKQQPLMTMQFEEAQQQELWIDEVLVPASNPEDRLSALCYAVLQLSAQSTPFGLRLGGREIAPSQGLEHRRRLLEQLARHGFSGTPA